MQVPENQKKQLITLSLAGAVLLAGIVAGLLVVQNQQIIRNRAADVAPSCSTPKGTCTVPAAGADGYTPFIINVKEIAPDGSSKTIATSPQNAVDPNDPSKTAPVVFDANPLMRYVCEVAPVSITKDCQPVTVEMNAPVCKPPTNPGNPETPNTPPGEPDSPDIIPGDPGTPPKACACGADGGTLDCKTPTEVRVEGYQGEQGPGLIVINPKYTGAKNACFQCEKIVVSDGTREVGSYNCITPIPTSGALIPTPGIRLHIANGEICRDYSIKVIGKGETTTTAATNSISCANCTGRVCCPACTPPVKSSDCDPKKCDFNINFEGGALCGAIGKSTTVIPIGSSNYSFDFDEEPYNPSSGNTHRYKNAGVYDIKMSCNVDPSTGEGSTCTQRITVGCGKPSTTPSFPNTTPSFPDTTTTYDCPKITFVNKDMCIK